jgi:hypothetical protein
MNVMEWTPNLDADLLQYNKDQSWYTQPVHTLDDTTVYRLVWRTDSDPKSRYLFTAHLAYPSIGDYAPDEYEMLLVAEEGAIPSVKLGACLIRVKSSTDYTVTAFGTRLNDISESPRSKILNEYLESYRLHVPN